MDTKFITINRKMKLDFQTNEAYKTLRTNIEFCGNNVKVVAITSCVPNEGKSSVSFNLAISMAEAGKHVLYYPCVTFLPKPLIKFVPNRQRTHGFPLSGRESHRVTGQNCHQGNFARGPALPNKRRAI